MKYPGMAGTGGNDREIPGSIESGGGRAGDPFCYGVYAGHTTTTVFEVAYTAVDQGD
jgi:hypothetical protein